ncbi:MAG: hypothetical protein Q8N44_18400 [Rubrivivax sp.]|nr:hypothetical protein [Rubrivivax sp.]
MTAHRIDADSGVHDLPRADMHVGDRPRVRPGERAPVVGVDANQVLWAAAALVFRVACPRAVSPSQGPG